MSLVRGTPPDCGYGNADTTHSDNIVGEAAFVCPIEDVPYFDYSVIPIHMKSKHT